MILFYSTYLFGKFLLAKRGSLDIIFQESIPFEYFVEHFYPFYYKGYNNMLEIPFTHRISTVVSIIGYNTTFYPIIFKIDNFCIVEFNCWLSGNLSSYDIGWYINGLHNFLCLTHELFSIINFNRIIIRELKNHIINYSFSPDILRFQTEFIIDLFNKSHEVLETLDKFESKVYLHSNILKRFSQPVIEDNMVFTITEIYW